MNLCESCEDTGLVPFVYEGDPDPVTPEDLRFALCLCDAGQSLRRSTNNGRPVPALWEVWAAMHQVPPSRIVRVEDVFSGEELAAAGFGQPVATIDREARLLAASRRRQK